MRPLFSYSPFAVFGLLVYVLCNPIICRSPENARKSSCQSNLKQIGLALQQYNQDYDDHFPRRRWMNSLEPYTRIKADVLYQCPSTEKTPDATDYFFSSRFLNGRLRDIEDPARLVLIGDGTNDALPNTTLYQYPPSWQHDKTSPALRHLETANYGFADGHVKALRPGAVKPDFKWRNS